jgi:hypothetical protein
MNKICYWDEKDGVQKERDATPEEQEEIDSRKLSSEDINRPIIAQLERIDAKSIRAIREGDQSRIASWNEEAANLRAQLIKD